MVFIQRGIPAAAFTSQQFPYLTSAIANTAQDHVELADSEKLVQNADAICRLLQVLTTIFQDDRL